nr:5-hydroxytryptamine receptor 7 [Podarcis muralis]
MGKPGLKEGKKRERVNQARRRNGALSCQERSAVGARVPECNVGDTRDLFRGGGQAGSPAFDGALPLGPERASRPRLRRCSPSRDAAACAEGCSSAVAASKLPGRTSSGSCWAVASRLRLSQWAVLCRGSHCPLRRRTSASSGSRADYARALGAGAAAGPARGSCWWWWRRRDPSPGGGARRGWLAPRQRESSLPGQAEPLAAAAARALGVAAAARRGGHAGGWLLLAWWAALLNMVLDVHGAGSCPLVSSPRRCFAPHAPRQLGSGGAAAAAMISGSLHPPRLGIGGKLLQGVTASPGGSGHAGSGSGVGSGAGSGSSSPSPGFGDVGNDTQCGEQILSYGNVEKVVIGAALSLITLLTIAGNCLVVISVCFVKKLRQPSNYLIVSLALADLSVAVAVMPFVSVTDLIGGEWIFGSFFCNVFIAMDVMCCTASIMTLCVISIDRYLGITRPLTYPVRQNGKCMAKMILSVWLLSASITLPPLFGWAQNINDDKVCLISQDFGYTIYSTAVAFYIPMSVMLFMYYQIFKAAKKSAAKHKFAGFPRPEENEGIVSANGIAKLHKESEECTNFSRLLKHERKNISIFKREQKAATTLGIVVGAFTVCWLPFFILSTARPFICGTSCSCIPLWVERTFLWLGYANSLINPFIYAFFNRDLRTTYRNLLQCRYRNINRKLSAAGMHEALKLAEKPEFVLRSSDYSRKKSHDL